MNDKSTLRALISLKWGARVLVARGAGD